MHTRQRKKKWKKTTRKIAFASANETVKKREKKRNEMKNVIKMKHEIVVHFVLLLLLLLIRCHRRRRRYFSVLMLLYSRRRSHVIVCFARRQWETGRVIHFFLFGVFISLFSSSEIYSMLNHLNWYFSSRFFRLFAISCYSFIVLNEAKAMPPSTAFFTFHLAFYFLFSVSFFLISQLKMIYSLNQFVHSRSSNETKPFSFYIQSIHGSTSCILSFAMTIFSHLPTAPMSFGSILVNANWINAKQLFFAVWQHKELKTSTANRCMSDEFRLKIFVDTRH